MINDRDEVGYLDTRSFQLTLAKIANKTWLQKFVETPAGDLMLLRYTEGLFRFDEKQQGFVRDSTTIPLPKNWLANEVVWDKARESYWITTDSGIVMYHPSTRQLNYRQHNPSDDAVIKAFQHLRNVSAVYADKRGNIFFSRWPHLAGSPTYYRFNNRNAVADSTIIYRLGYHEPKGYLEQANGRFWVYGMPFLMEWPWDQKDVIPIPNEYKNEQSIKYDYINSAFEDREQNIWLATDNGVFYFNPDEQVFDSYRLLRADGRFPQDHNVHAMHSLDNGNILVGCWGAGLFYYDKQFNPLPFPPGLRKLPYTTSVWDMATNPKTRDVWITLQGGGIIVYNQKKDTYVELFPEIFERSTIRQVDEDTTGNMWFGTQNGLIIKWDLQKSGNDPSRGYELIMRTGLVRKVHYDYKGFIYAASMGFGLHKIDVRTGKLVKTFNDYGAAGERLFMNSPMDMTYYNDSTLLIAAGCINILNTKTDKISFISTDNGLPFNGCESIERDENDIIWIGMTNGICRLNMKKQLITYYDRRDGIPYDKFSGAGVQELRDGRISFFTDHNFLVFDPARFTSVDRPPVAEITGFQLAGKMLSLDSLKRIRTTVLPYNDNSATISFSALTYLPQRKILYYYKLENFDADWIKSDKPLQVNYNYLPPGDYVFKVKTENADGLTSEKETHFNITVRPPFWNTWWFLSLAALAVAAVLYLLDRERMTRQRSMQLLRRQIRRNLAEEVSTTLNNINVLSEMAKIKADKNVDQAKTYIDQISDKSRSMMEVLDDTLWSIDPQNDSMAQTLLRINELTDGVKSSYDVDVDLIVDNRVQALKLDMKVRHEFYFFYKESLLFLVEEINAKQVFVNLNLVRSRLMLEILSEVSTDQDLEAMYLKALQKRISNLPATIDLLTEGNSFAVVIFMDVRK